jgi:hypothetical protein
MFFLYNKMFIKCNKNMECDFSFSAPVVSPHTLQSEKKSDNRGHRGRSMSLDLGL